MATTIVTQSNSEGVVNIATAKLTTNADAAAAYTLALGFTPRRVRIVNVKTAAGVVINEWYEGMPAAAAVVTDGTVATGTTTYVTTGGITVADGVVTFASAIMVASGTFYVLAEG